MPSGTFTDLPHVTPTMLQPAPSALDDLKPPQRRMHVGRLLHQGTSQANLPPDPASISLAHPWLSHPGPMDITETNPTDEWAKPTKRYQRGGHWHKVTGWECPCWDKAGGREWRHVSLSGRIIKPNTQFLHNRLSPDLIRAANFRGQERALCFLPLV